MMALTKEQKIEAIQAKRGPLEHEQYAAELDLKVAKKSDDKALAEEPQARLDEVNAKLDALKQEEQKL